jgi:hypothetical protein
MPADFFRDIKGVRAAEAAGKQAAPAYRRAAGVQDFIQDALDFLNVSLNVQRH